MKKTIIKALLIVFSVILIFIGIAIYGVYDYIQGSAKFESYNRGTERIQVEAGREYDTSQFAILVRGVNPEFSSANWANDNSTDGIEISYDRKTIVFNQTGTAEVVLTAYGTKTEGAAIRVYVDVK